MVEFVEKLNEDEEFLRESLEGEAEWIQVQEVYEELFREIWEVVTPLTEKRWGDYRGTAKNEAEVSCMLFKGSLKEMHEEMGEVPIEEARSVMESFREEVMEEKEKLARKIEEKGKEL